LEAAGTHALSKPSSQPGSRGVKAARLQRLFTYSQKFCATGGLMKFSYCFLLALLTAGLQTALFAASTSFTDSFSSYTQNTCFADGTSFGPWTLAFSGFGCAQVQSSGAQSWLDEAPEISTDPSQSHSSLALGPSFSNALTLSVGLNTVTQLRQGSLPNAWEVGWVIWHYTDNSHFYYFIAKPNGWELGKEDPAYSGSQRFLATGSSPTFSIGTWHNITIIETTQNTITVYADGNLITTFTDMERPYTSGRIGLYDEESHVQFQNVSAYSTH
jgi:hypothetical protein